MQNFFLAFEFQDDSEFDSVYFLSWSFSSFIRFPRISHSEKLHLLLVFFNGALMYEIDHQISDIEKV